MVRVWTDTAGTLTAGSGGGQDFKSLAELAVTDTRYIQQTLLRTIIGLNVGLTVHDSGEGSQLVSLGIGIVSSDAYSAGLTALPDPRIDADFPTRGWIWRARYRVFGFAADQPAVYTQRIDLDMRSQRKLDNGIPLFIITNENVEGAASTITVHGLIRQLWLVR